MGQSKSQQPWLGDKEMLWMDPRTGHAGEVGTMVAFLMEAGGVEERQLLRAVGSEEVTVLCKGVRCVVSQWHSHK